MTTCRCDDYIAEFRRELRRRGVFGSRVVDEVRGHLFDAIDAGERDGLDTPAAEVRAIARLGSASALAHTYATDRSFLMQRMLLLVAIVAGVGLAYLDSRPSWDDTGISAGVLLIAAGILGALGPQRPWLWALCIGVWIPVYGIAHSVNYGSLIALAVAFVGAYAGMFVRRAIIPI